MRTCSAPRRAAALCALLPALPVLVACQPERQAGTGPFAAQVASAVPAIERSTGLKFKTTPKVETRTKDEVRGFLEKKFDEATPALELAGAERAYKLFGLLPDTLDLRRYLLSLLTEQVVGYYDPSTKVLYVVSGDGTPTGTPSPDVVNITITHELVHALQDQYFPLDSLEKSHGDNDRQSAAQAVIEGQATYEQMAAMLGGGSFITKLPGGWERVREMIREAQGQMPVFSTAPMLIQETLLFPYLSGAEFVRAFKEKRPGQVPFRPLPSSTKQVMHPERFVDSLDVPTRVSLPPPMGATVVYENDLGEFETRLLLFQSLKDVQAAARGAAGWSGDRFYVVHTPKGDGLTWLSVWDTTVEAAEFRELMERAVEKRFALTPGSGGSGAVRHFAARGRQLELEAATVQGRPAVLFTDVPAGAGTKLIDLSKVKLSRDR